MTQTKSSSQGIAEGDRIYATENVYFGHGDYLDVPRGTEGTVAQLTGDDAHDLFVEFDNGVAGAVNSGSVALIADPPALCGKDMRLWPYGACTEKAGHAGHCDRR